MKKRALLFDMDGVLSLTEHVHFQAYLDLFNKELGVPLTRKELAKVYDVGGQDLYITRDLLKLKGLRWDYRRINKLKVRHVVPVLKRGFKRIPGAKRFISRMADSYKLGVASQSARVEIRTVLDGMGIRKHISCIVGKEDVTRYKPYPQAYRLLVRKLGVTPSKCLVFEDSALGVEAAKRAKMEVVALLTTTKKSFLKRADHIIKDFTDPRLKKILSDFG